MAILERPSLEDEGDARANRPVNLQVSNVSMGNDANRKVVFK